MALDPAFAAAVRAVWGDAVDPREAEALAKGMPDSSAVHVPAAPSARKRKALAAGLVLGTTAEALAAGRTVRPALQAIRNVDRSASALRRTAKVGEMALQGGNATVGLTAAAALAPRRKVAKAQQHMRPRALVASAARLRRLEQQPVGKGLLSGARDAARLTGHLGSVEHRSYLTGVQTDALKARFAGREGRLTPAHAANPPRGQHRAAGRRVPALGVAALGGAAAGAGGTVAATRRKPQEVGKAEFRGVVSKVDTEHRNVFGWCSLAILDGQPVVDLQGDYVSVEEIEKSAYSYVLNSRVGGDMHRRLPLSKLADGGPVHTADLIESVVFTPEKLEKMGLPPDALPHGWWVGYHVNDDQQWADVKAGKRLGFSIHGTGLRKEWSGQC